MIRSALPPPRPVVCPNGCRKRRIVYVWPVIGRRSKWLMSCRFCYKERPA